MNQGHHVTTYLIHEVKLPSKPARGNARRLGRHVEHDSRSRAHPFIVKAEHAGKPLVSKVWARHCAAFDQGDLGECVGEAAAGVAMTDPIWKPGRAFVNADATRLYARATELDKIPGQYPPDDTGSSGLAGAKALKEAGIISGYRHAFTMHAALQGLAFHGPALLGIDWFEGFDSPKGHAAECDISGAVRGGHEIALTSIDVVAQTVGFWNSWGKGWGIGGEGLFTWGTFAALLARKADVIFLDP